MKSFGKITFAVVCLLAASMNLGAAWTTKRLSNNDGVSRYSDVAVWGQNIYTVWTDFTPGNYEIFFRRSADGGATWYAARKLTNSVGTSLNPAIAVSGPNVYVVWMENPGLDPEIHIRKSTDGGETWGTARNLSNNAGISQYPRLAVNGSEVYVVWQDETPGKACVFIRTSTDGGATWNAARRLSNNIGGAFTPRIALDSPNVYVVWQDHTSGTAEVYFRTSTDGGLTWAAARKVSNNAGASCTPDIAVSGTNVYVVWNDDTPGNYEIHFRRSTDGGATWLTVQRLTNNAGASAEPVIAVNGPTILVVWHDDTPGVNEIFWRITGDRGATWDSVRNLSNNSGSSCDPNIAADSASVFVVWEDYTPGNDEIYLKYSSW